MTDDTSGSGRTDAFADGHASADGHAAGGDARPAPDLAEETRRVVGALQDWMQRSVPEAHGGPDCQWCPICQLAGVLRGERPDVAEKLAEAGTAIAGAVKALVDAAAAHTSDGGAVHEPAAQRRRPRPRVERVDLDETD